MYEIQVLFRLHFGRTFRCLCMRVYVCVSTVGYSRIHNTVTTSKKVDVICNAANTERPIGIAEILSVATKRNNTGNLCITVQFHFAAKMACLFYRKSIYP